MRILFVNNLRGYYGGVEQVVEDYTRGHECFLAYAEDGRSPDLYGQSFVETYACAEFGRGY